MAHYRVRRYAAAPGYGVTFIEDTRERAVNSAMVQDQAEAASMAALAILADYLHGDSPRAWRLADAFEREFLSGDFTERTIDVGAVAQWVQRRERSSRG